MIHCIGKPCQKRRVKKRRFANSADQKSSCKSIIKHIKGFTGKSERTFKWSVRYATFKRFTAREKDIYD